MKDAGDASAVSTAVSLRFGRLGVAMKAQSVGGLHRIKLDFFLQLWA